MTIFKTLVRFVALLTIAACAPMTDSGEIIKESDNARPADPVALGDCVPQCAKAFAGDHSSGARAAEDRCVADCSGH